MSTTIHIKNMVCPRCIQSVESLLSEMHIPYESVELGIASLKETISESQEKQLQEALSRNGFELLKDRQDSLVNSIKTLILDVIYGRKQLGNSNFSSFLSSHLNTDYSVLSKLFSQLEGTTIEKYIQLQKIERVKELISYGEKTLNEIAYMLDYSSPSHLSGQFKKITGLSPSEYKKSDFSDRNSLDAIG